MQYYHGKFRQEFVHHLIHNFNFNLNLESKNNVIYKKSKNNLMICQMY